MSALNFTADDLEANRDGYMTKHQRAIINDDRAVWAVICRLIPVILILAIVLAIWDGARIGDTAASRCGIVALLLLFAGAGYYYADSQWRQRNHDQSKGDVVMLDGEVTLRKYTARN